MSRSQKWAGDGAPQVDAGFVRTSRGMTEGRLTEAQGSGRARATAGRAGQTANAAAARVAEIRERLDGKVTTGTVGTALAALGAALVTMLGIQDPVFRGIAASLPLIVAAASAWSLTKGTRDDVEDLRKAGAALQWARSVSAQAHELEQAIMGAADAAGISPTSRALVNALLEGLERQEQKVRESDGARLSPAGRAKGKGSLSDRRHERIEPRQRRTTVSLPNGQRLEGRISNVSISGVALTMPNGERLQTGTTVVVGSRRATLKRTAGGVQAFEFAVPLDGATFDENVVL